MCFCVCKRVFAWYVCVNWMFFQNMLPEYLFMFDGYFFNNIYPISQNKKLHAHTHNSIFAQCTIMMNFPDWTLLFNCTPFNNRIEISFCCKWIFKNVYIFFTCFRFHTESKIADPHSNLFSVWWWRWSRSCIVSVRMKWIEHISLPNTISTRTHIHADHTTHTRR